MGKCSLTVALPIISACGVECAVVPTAVLSTHTAFTGHTFHDLTGEMAPIEAHWRREGFHFDALYTGYLGSREQIELVQNYFRDFGHRDNLIVVDPVMGDNSKLYAGFTPDFAREMARLAEEADVIVPNLTEAPYLLGIPYRTDRNEEELHELLRDFAGLGAKNVVLTGVSLRPGELGAMGYSAASGTFFYHASEHLPVSFHGTGDVFASALVGALTRRRRRGRRGLYGRMPARDHARPEPCLLRRELRDYHSVPADTAGACRGGIRASPARRSETKPCGSGYYIANHAERFEVRCRRVNVARA